MRLDTKAILARANAATEGPWGTCGDSSKDSADVTDARGFSVFEAWSSHADSGQNLTNEDRDFIAAARTDVPALCAEVERLREAIERAIETLGRRGVTEELRRALEGE